MRNLIYTTFLLLYLSSQCAQCSYEDEFVDPTDMLNYDRSTRSMRKPKPKTLSETVQNDRCTVFLSRFVKMLIKNTGLSKNLNSEKKNDEKVKSRVSVTLTVQDLKLLENMADKKDIDYIEIDRIINNMFSFEKENSFEFKMDNDFGEIYNQIKTVLFWILMGFVVIFCLFMIFQNIRNLFSLTFVVFIIFAFAFASTWYTMYTKAEINRSVHLEYMPSQCKKAEGWLSSFSWFKKHDLDECKRYKEAIYLDPKFSIALTEVFAEMFSKILMKPIEILGDSIHVFNKSVLRDFPMWAQLILVPIIIIIIIKTTLLACALLVGRHLSIKSMFGYGSTSIGSGPSNNESFTRNNKTNISTHPITSENPAVQIPAAPNINFNINFMHPNSSNISSNNTIKPNDFLFNRKNLKVNYKQENDLISMLKDKEIDSVDSKNCNDLIVKRPRHRTLSI